MKKEDTEEPLYVSSLGKHSLPNGWDAVSVVYREHGTAAAVLFRQEQSGEETFSALRRPSGDFARFANRHSNPALQGVPGGAVDFLEILVDARMSNDKLARSIAAAPSLMKNGK